MHVFSHPFCLFAPLLMVCIIETYAKDYYQVLGVKRNAREKDIAKAYRRLAREFHPDKNQDDPKAEDKFIEITKAYEVLGDPTSRRRYDEENYAKSTLSTGGQKWVKPSRGNAVFREFNQMFDDLNRQFNQDHRPQNRNTNREDLEENTASS